VSFVQAITVFGPFCRGHADPRLAYELDHRIVLTKLKRFSLTARLDWQNASDAAALKRKELGGSWMLRNAKVFSGPCGDQRW
jgi:hypothetical protein